MWLQSKVWWRAFNFPPNEWGQQPRCCYLIRLNKQNKTKQKKTHKIIMRIISNLDGNCNSTISFLRGGSLVRVTKTGFLTFGLNLFPTFAVYFCVWFVCRCTDLVRWNRACIFLSPLLLSDDLTVSFHLRLSTSDDFCIIFFIVISFSLVDVDVFTSPFPPRRLSPFDLNWPFDFPHWIIIADVYVLNAFNRFNSSIEFNPMGGMEWEPFELGAFLGPMIINVN
jgi:hypothetical protein